MPRGCCHTPVHLLAWSKFAVHSLCAFGNQGGTVEISAPDVCQGRLFCRKEGTMKRRWFLLCTVLMLMFLLIGCKVSGHPLPEGMEEDDVLEQGRELSLIHI